MEFNQITAKVCRNRRNGDMISNPTNCRAYIECQQNLRLDRECGNGELFDPVSSVCLIGFMVDCGARTIETADTTTRNVSFFNSRFFYLVSLPRLVDLLWTSDWHENFASWRVSNVLWMSKQPTSQHHVPTQPIFWYDFKSMQSFKHCQLWKSKKPKRQKSTK